MSVAFIQCYPKSDHGAVTALVTRLSMRPLGRFATTSYVSWLSMRYVRAKEHKLWAHSIEMDQLHDPACNQK